MGLIAEESVGAECSQRIRVGTHRSTSLVLVRLRLKERVKLREGEGFNEVFLELSFTPCLDA